MSNDCAKFRLSYTHTTTPTPTVPHVRRSILWLQPPRRTGEAMNLVIVILIVLLVVIALGYR